MSNFSVIHTISNGQKEGGGKVGTKNKYNFKLFSCCFVSLFYINYLLINDFYFLALGEYIGWK